MKSSASETVQSNAAVVALIPRMDAVNEYRGALQRLQDGWDQLSLLGQMTGSAADIVGTGREFSELTTMLLDALANRLLSNAQRAMTAKAQVAIDILIRNLFERTADVGFLAADAPIREFLSGSDRDGRAESKRQLERRFAAYVAKYSVYDDIVVLSPDGQVQVRLDQGIECECSRHPLVHLTATTSAPFVETFGEIDFIGRRRGLIYSASIRAGNGSEVLGVLCLSFKFDDEMRAIFARLDADDESMVLALLNDARTVVSSSDEWQLPHRAPLADARGGAHRVRFAGREYLSTEVASKGYQGYSGPGWTSSALLPVDLAFRSDDTDSRSTADALPATLERGLRESSLFGQELVRIPQLARAIQQRLERSVWNGQVRGRHRTDGESSGFANALLQQIAATGVRVTSVFENAIADLQRAALSSIVDEVRFNSALAIDIMDRNLYERANDCRWWALDSTLQHALVGKTPDGFDEAASVLRHINSLYTVYSLLVLFDREGRVVATSSSDAKRWVGTQLDQEWVGRALTLRNRQDYAVSAFEPSALYGDRSTFIYCASVPASADSDQIVGGLAIVFDGAPQFEAMLRDALPRGEDGQPMPNAIGVFVDRGGLVISSSDACFAVGSRWTALAKLAHLRKGESYDEFVELDGAWYAVGATMAAGYREYNSTNEATARDVCGVVLVRLCEHRREHDTDHDTARIRLATDEASGASARDTLELAVFACGGQLLALPTSDIVEAIEVARLTELPGRPANGSNMVMYQGQALTVVDLALVRASEHRVAADTSRTIVVCRLKSSSKLMGLWIDELVVVMTVPAAASRPAPASVALHDPTCASVVQVVDLQGRTHLLTLLSIDQLQRVAADAHCVC